MHVLKKLQNHWYDELQHAQLRHETGKSGSIISRLHPSRMVYAEFLEYVTLQKLHDEKIPNYSIATRKYYPNYIFASAEITFTLKLKPNCKATMRPEYQQTFKYEHKMN